MLPHPVSACLAAPLDVVDKVLLTDLCNRLSTRAPVERSISGRAACAAPTAEFFPDRGRVLPCGARPSCDDPTPAESTLDGVPLQLRSNSRTMKPASSPLGARSVGDRRAVPLHTGLVDPGGAGERPLTPTSPPSVSSTGAEPSKTARTTFTALPSRSSVSPIPGAFHRHVLPEPRFRGRFVWCGSPPPISPFCHGRSGFRRSFTPRCALARGS